MILIIVINKIKMLLILIINKPHGHFDHTSERHTTKLTNHHK